MKYFKKKILLLGSDKFETTKLKKIFGSESFTSKFEDCSAIIAFTRRDLENILYKNLDFSKINWFHLPGAGIENYLDFIKKHTDINFTNGKVIQGPQVADHAMALLLSLTRKTYFITKYGQSKPFDFRPIELNDKKALVVGYGGIGKSIVARLFGFGCKVDVVNFNQNISKIDQRIDNHFYFSDISKAVSLADFIFIAIPKTKLTNKLFDDKLFKKFKKNSILINVTRGKIICTNSLIKYIKNKKLFAVGLDVTDPEPLPKSHPLLNYKNVLVTPHIAGISDNFKERSFNLIRSNINRYHKGEDLINIVNKKNSY